MRRTALTALVLLNVFLGAAGASPREGTPGLPGAVPRFRMEPTDINLARSARPFTPFDKVGRRFALIGSESGTFEAWAWPLKILRGFDLSFLLGTSTTPVRGQDIVRSVSVDPAVTTLTFTFQSFTVKAHYVAAVDDPGAVILLEIDAAEPLTVVCSFIPVLQPMWPAGIGGQYASWDDEAKAYVISEPTRKNHGMVGSPAAAGISYTPAHMLSDSPNQFKIVIADPEAAAGVFIPVVVAGGKGRRDDVRAAYRKLAAEPEACYLRTADHYRLLRESTIRLSTPDRRLDLAFEWAKVSLDSLFADNPDLGLGLVAGLGPSGAGGRPGFGWFFGTDAYLNSMSFNSLGAVSRARDALSFTQKWQREDGKMAHELSQAAGYVDWWKGYPYGYIHGDTTPYYIVAVEDYVRASGDLEYLRSSWPSLKRAFHWCVSTDADGDGLMDNSRAGLGALEFGSLTGIRTDIYLAAVWARAARAMQDLAAAIGDGAAVKSAEAAAVKAARAVDERFWDAANGQYSYAFNEKGRLVEELTPWSAVALAWGLGTRERGEETLARLNAADMTTDWGVRMLSRRSPLFEPLNYNYGAAWPFLTGWVSAALFEYGFGTQGYALLSANAAHTFDNQLGAVTELFSGFTDIWPQEGVPHQGFSTTGIVLPAVRGLLGLEADALRGALRFAPTFPADWPQVSVTNVPLGGRRLSLAYERGERIVRLKVRSEGGSGAARLVFSPAFGPATRVVSASLNGSSLRVDPGASGAGRQCVRPSVEAALSGDDVIEIGFEPAPEIVLPVRAAVTGDTDRGLKIIRTETDAGHIKIEVEGLAGERHEIGARNADRIAAVTGADLAGGRILLTFPPGRPGEFTRREIVLRLKD